MSLADSILDFNAGRVMYISHTGQATPLPGKGKFVLGHSSEDPSLLSCRWIPRGDSRDNPSEELLLIPGDVFFKQATECKTGRVVQMEYRSSGERHFYWLQAATPGDVGTLTNDDKQIITKLNELTSTFDDDHSDFDMDVESDTAGFETANEIHPNETEPGSNTNSGLPVSEPHSQLSPTAMEQSEPLSKIFNVLRRQEHVSTVNDSDLQKLLHHTSHLASSRSELSEVVTSPYFSQALDQLAFALAESPALSIAMGLPRAPRSVEELLELLRNLE